MPFRVRTTARVGWSALSSLLATAALAAPSIRVGYVTAHEAHLLTTDVAAPVASAPAKIEPLENAPQGAHAFRVTGLQAGQITNLALASVAGTDPILQITPAPTPPQPLHLRLTGPIPAQADPADLELVAAALLARDAHATVSIGGLFAFEDRNRIAAAGYDRAARRRLEDRSWQSVWRSGAHFGVLGALDYGPPGATRHWSNRRAALDAFKQFWTPPNHPLATTPAIYEFTLGDVACFVLDGFSLANGVEQTSIERSILGRAQREWLANALALSKAPFKLIFCGRPLLVPSEQGAALHRFDHATRQFLKIFDGPGTDGVLLVTSGGPVGELTRYIRSSGYPLNELALGPLARSFDPREPYQELNYFRVPGTLVREPHFAAIEIGGAAETRHLRLSAHRLDGTEIWAETIEAADLKD